MKTSESLDQLIPALVKVQSEMKPAIKDSVNPHYKSNYADLASCWEACRGPLTKNSFCIVQSMDEEGLVLFTRLLHVSGQWVQSDAPILVGKLDNPQAWGSALTYARRYSLMALIGISPEDDDGESAISAKSATLPAGIKPAVSQSVDMGEYVPKTGELAGDPLKKWPIPELDKYLSDLSKKEKTTVLMKFLVQLESYVDQRKQLNKAGQTPFEKESAQLPKI